MQLVWILVLGGLIFFTYSQCSTEVYETEEYQMGFDEGYNAGYDFVWAHETKKLVLFLWKTMETNQDKLRDNPG